MTVEAFGHVALGKSRCVATAVADYLVAGKLSAEGAVCKADKAVLAG